MGTSERTPQPIAPLDDLERVFKDAAGGLLVQHQLRIHAYRDAVARLDSNGAASYAAGIVQLAFAADLMSALAADLAAQPVLLTRLIDQIEDRAGIPRLALGRQVLAAPQLLQLPASVAIEVQLTLLLAFTRALAVSLWTLWPGAGLSQIGHAGERGADDRQMREAAGRLLAERQGGPCEGGAAELSAVLVERPRQAPAALIVRGDSAPAEDRALLLESAVPLLSAIFDRDELLSRGEGPSPPIAGVNDRRLARLRFDLHDGPQQDVMLLAEDLRLFQSQLRSAVEGHPARERLLGRLDDLEARLVALDGDLRRISAASLSPFLQPEALPLALAHLTAQFAARTGIEPEVRLQGDFTQLTDSQQITLLGLMKEALNNIREHSEAEHVAISLSANAGGVEATVTDDGRGFDPEPALVKAAREGHLGLVGMHERVRMLGGQTRIDSRPGGPTVISVSLPPAPEGAPRRVSR